MARITTLFGTPAPGAVPQEAVNWLRAAHFTVYQVRVVWLAEGTSETAAEYGARLCDLADVARRTYVAGPARLRDDAAAALLHLAGLLDEVRPCLAHLIPASLIPMFLENKNVL